MQMDARRISSRAHASDGNPSRHRRSWRQSGIDLRQMGIEGMDALAMVELEEGPRVMGNVIGIDIADVYIGLAVEATFVEVADDIGIPQWRRRVER